MIKTFTHKGLEDFFFDGTKKGIQAAHSQKLADILDRQGASHLEKPDECLPPCTLAPKSVNINASKTRVLRNQMPQLFSD